MDVNEATFHPIFWALGVGAPGDTYAVIVFVRWLRGRMKGCNPSEQGRLNRTS